MRITTVAPVAALLLAGCGEPPAPPVSDEAIVLREQQPALTQGYAEFRSTQIGNVRYELDVTLDPQFDYFEGSNRIRFDWLGSMSPLTIDWQQGEVTALRINGELADIDYNGLFITVPAALLQAGENEIFVGYRHAWSDNGSGFYRFDDPDDGRTYLYTDFEPRDASRAFPVFDQPDIKARTTLSVTAPADWVVVSTTGETSVDDTGATKRWRFPETPPISTYIMSLHAGPYAVWQDNAFRYPLRLLVRRSLALYVEPDVPMWFDYTRRGFDFFEEYYGVPYAFGKYDQIIVPDFNSGAMENAGAVTFNENGFVQRDGEWTAKEHRWLVGVILHEMAHMWFGDFVTMKWWNGLWLNETFAEFMGYHAARKSMDIADTWETFFIDRKYVAYWTDLRSTTHPVETPVPDSDEVGTNFDMISYAKGASVLRQMEFRIGEDAFRRGISIYLRRHAEGNAVLDDFVAALEEASGTELRDWAQEWLFTAGPNTIEAQYTCSEGQISDFALAQSAMPEYPILRTQKVNIGLFRDTGENVELDREVTVTYSGAVTAVPEANGAPCPDVVYPNYGDMGYVLVRLDPRTRENITNMIGRVADDFQRVMFWQTLWDNVRYAQIPVTDYLDAVFASAADEDDVDNVDQIYAFVGTAIDYLRSMHEPGSRLLADYRPRAEAITWANVERTRGDLQAMYLDRYLEFASSPTALERLANLLTGKAEIPGRELDQDRRWDMLRVLSAEGDPRTSKLLQIEKERDPSNHGRRAAVGVESAWPDVDVKRAVIADVVNRNSENSYALQRIAMNYLFPTGQQALHEALADEIFEQILANEREADPAYYARAAGFASYLTPATCTEASVARLREAAELHSNSRPAIRDTMRDELEDDELCLARAKLVTESPG